MFIATLFIITKIWKQAKCPSNGERKYIYTTEYYSAIKKNEILSFSTTWMDREGMCSEICQRNTNTAFYHFHVESKYKTKE